MTCNSFSPRKRITTTKSNQKNYNYQIKKTKASKLKKINKLIFVMSKMKKQTNDKALWE